MVHITTPLSIEIPNTLREYHSYLQNLVASRNWDSPEASLLLPDEEKILSDVEAIKNRLSPNIKIAIVIGIGGSNLGTKAIADALGSLSATAAKFLYADTVDSWSMQLLLNEVKHRCKSATEVVLIIVSKSGTTTESAANFSVLLQGLKVLFGEFPSKQVVAISDSGSKLEQLARKEQYHSLTIPSSVGGRYSVFSAVGLLPLALAGIDTKALLLGAKTLRDQVLTSGTQNDASTLAVFLFDQMQTGRVIHDLFLFQPRLETLGKWYRQLFAESLGKDEKGMVPTISIGSTDLHSIGQLYLGGPKKVVTTFVSAKMTADFTIGADVSDLVSGIQGKSLGTIQNAILEATLRSYTNRQNPFVHILMDQVDEESVGAFLQFQMLTVMYLGKLMGVNAFDQQNVESYKAEMRKILET